MKRLSIRLIICALCSAPIVALLAGCIPPVGSSSHVAAPTFSPGGGTYSSDVSVELRTGTAGATIYYTLDGSRPSSSSATFSAPLNLTGNGRVTTVKAIAEKDGMQDSGVAQATYTISYSQVAKPQFSPAPGTYSSDQNVIITSITTGSAVYYTTDGTIPTTSSTPYTGAVPAAGDGTSTIINAIATEAGMADSEVATGTYTINYSQVSTPHLTPGSSTVALGDTIVFSDTTAGVTFHYTTDGSQPTASSPSAASYTIAGPVTLNVIATKSGMTASPAATADYAVQLPAPTFNPAAGSVLRGTTITFSCSIPGVTFYYNLNGSTPTTSSATGPGYTINDSTTITVIAAKQGWITSQATSGFFYPEAAAAPTFSPNVTLTAAYLTSDADVTITSSTAGASIYYTIDGPTPTTASQVYSSPVHLAGNGTTVLLQAIAVKSGLVNSGVTSTTYRISYPITTVAGNGTSGNTSGGGSALSAELYQPTRIAVGPAGNLYIVDTTNNEVRRVTPAGTISVFAGTGTAGDTSGDGGLATAATLNAPDDVGVDSAGNVYIADSGNFELRKVDTNGIITAAGNLGSGPNAIAVSPGGEPIYVAQYWGHAVYPIINGVATSNVAGTTTQCGYSGDNGPATSALLCYPSDIDLDASGNLYIYDGGNYRIRKIDTNGIITTVAGTGSYTGANPSLNNGGPATSAEINMNGYLALDATGNIFVEWGSTTIRTIDLAGIIRTVVGGGSALGDGGPALRAQLLVPRGVAVGPQGNLYIADKSDSRIRKATQ